MFLKFWTTPHRGQYLKQIHIRTSVQFPPNMSNTYNLNDHSVRLFSNKIRSLENDNFFSKSLTEKHVNSERKDFNNIYLFM